MTRAGARPTLVDAPVQIVETKTVACVSVSGVNLDSGAIDGW